MNRFLLLLLVFILSASSLNDARKANNAFRSGDYETAVQLYRQAIDQNPGDARLHFNLGSALAKLGQSEQAVRAFETAKELMDDPRQQAMADYNAGTHLSEAGMYDEAVNFFREALRKNPDDSDIKHNYEMSIRKQQEEEQEQEQDDQDQDDQDQNQEQQQDQDSGDDQQQEQNQDQQQNDQSEGSPDEQDPRDHELPNPDDISKEEAENILNALDQLEREILENRKKEAEIPKSSNEKDW